MVAGFELSECVGKTTGSQVYRARQSSDMRPVILRIAAQDHPHGAELRQEFEFIQRFHVPGLLSPIGLAANDGPAMVLQDCPGMSLKSMLDKGRLGLMASLQIASNVARTLGGIHSAGVVYQDLRPANILVSADDWSTCILDCSVCSGAITSEARERNWAFISPEQTGRIKRTVDYRADLYALGVLLYQMLTGRVPFQAGDPLEWVHAHIARIPASPSELVPEIPTVLSELVLKLLAKPPEDRYQSASGLEHDLQECIARLSGTGAIAPFALGTDDVPEQFHPSQKLYGRRQEIAELVSVFKRTAESGLPEMVLISGDTGIGKSALVHEAQRAILEAGGRFIEGKFDQHKREVPFSTLTEAFRDLVQQILTESDERIATLREQIRQSLGPNGQLILDVIPQLELIVGPQPPVPEVAPDAAQKRFRHVFRSFISVFTRRERPLVLFLDDVQWVDSASLALAAQLMAPCHECHILLIAAYRDSEVPDTHPMNAVIAGLRHAGTGVTHVQLDPLHQPELNQFLADTLHSTPEECAPLGEIIAAKTQNNPFFVLQFLTALYEEQLIRFDAKRCRWTWDIAAIQERNLTDNVADLMAEKLNRLPERVRRMLQLAGCLGNEFDLPTLATVMECSQGDTAADLNIAVKAGVVVCSEKLTCRFLHDRIHDAAYSLLPPEERPTTHLHIGRLMLASWPEHTILERLFEVVSQFSRGAQVLTDEGERKEIRRLQVLAGKRAKSEGAFASARDYFANAAALFSGNVWTSDYEEAFSTWMELAQCQYLAGDLHDAEKSFQLLMMNTRSNLDRARVCRLKLNGHSAAGHYDKSLDAALDGLRLLGISIPDSGKELEDTTHDCVRRVQEGLHSRSIAALANTPAASDERVIAAIGLLVETLPGAYIARPQLYTLVAAKAVDLSLEFGATEESAVAYALYCLVLVSQLEEYESAVELCEMALRLSEQRGWLRFRGRLLTIYGSVVRHWRAHVSGSSETLVQALHANLAVGDFEYASFAAHDLGWTAFSKGDPLDSVLGLCQEHEKLARSTHNDILGQISALERQLVACLKGSTREETSFAGEDFDESSYLSSMEQSSFGTGRTYYEVAKEIATFILGHPQQAIQHGRGASLALPALPALMIEASHLFFYALATASVYPDAPSPEQQELSQRLHGTLQKLKLWAEECPDNFLNWYALVSAEVARIEGRELDAERSYEQAIDSARQAGFTHCQAIASELASKFYRARGFDGIADLFLKDACSLYRRWGADAKVAQLRRMYPQLRPGAEAGGPALGEQLDAMAVVRASQAVSSQIELDQLLRTLMTIALQSAGAQKACLFLASGNAMELAATGTASQAQTSILVRGDAGFSEQTVPLSVINYVRRTKQKVSIDEGRLAGPFSADEYLLKEKPRSLLCLPLLKQQELTGLLCLENHSISQAFTPQRIAMLEAVAAQAAISLQNAQLYASLQHENTERKRTEELLRRKEALLAQGEQLSHTGSVYRNLVTGERHWSDEFCRLLGYEPGMQGSIDAFLSRVHPDDRADFHVQTEDLARLKTDQERHFRLALPDGSIRYVHNINRPVLNEAGVTVAVHGVVVDETERRRAELLREGEARVLEMIARSAPLKEILSELVRVVESQSDGMLCTVLLLDKDGVHIRHGASPSVPESYTGPIDGEMIGPRHGSCGTAAYRRETIVVSDIAKDPLWENWRNLALSHGLRACWSAPIFSSSGKVLGTFAMYYREPRSPSASEMKLIHFAAHLAGIGIERKSMEAELVESRNELQQVTDSISDSVWSADVSAKGEVTLRYSSPVIQRLTGHPPEFFMESPEGWLSVVHPEDKSWVRQRLQTSVKAFTAAPEAEYRIVMPDGSIRWIRDSVRCTPLENGGMRMHGVLTDITSRKQTEEALQQSRELLQSVLDGSEAVIYVKDLEGRYLLANRRVSELCRASQETIIGKTDYDLFPYEHAEGFRRGDLQALTAGAPIELEETTMGPDHRLRTYISVKAVLRDKKGSPYAVCGVSTDITERKRLEEQLREAQKMDAIGKLAGGIAHDFNNLMTIVTGYSELLQAALAGSPDLQEKAAEVHKAGEQAASLTRQLLAFSRRQVLQKKLLNLNEVLSGMSGMMRRLLRDDIELEIVPDPALALVRGDNGQFQQIIMNLIINARDAMPEGGRITITTANKSCDSNHLAGAGRQETCVRLTVSDTGHGMPPEIRERIFEPFFTTKEPGRGTGLGLATVHGVVQQAGGHVAVESEPGRGTTFHIYLPASQGEISSIPLQMPVPERGSETILVVEDQEGLRTLITEILRKHGYKVLAASNGREALRVLETTPGRIDLMVTDLVMPQMGGRALAAALPDVHPETRVVYMSGYVENLDELLAPGHTFIEKPFAPDALLRAVREVLDKRADLARPA